MKKGVIIQGSARSKGNTYTATQKLKALTHFDFIDLKEYHIGHYDYDFKNKADDFLPLIRSLLETYDIFVLASPVYWYTMSGHMKVFLDRISDLLNSDLEPRKLFHAKTMAVVSVSGQDDVDDSYYIPFRKSADYLGIHYLGSSHIYKEITDIELTRRFSEMLSD